MHKKLLALMCLIFISTNCFARTNISLGISQITAINDENSTEYSIGLGYDNQSYGSNGIYYGAQFDLSNAKIDDRSFTTYTYSIKLGYKILANTAAYALGSGITQTYKDNSAYGFGYGFGIDYRINKNFSLNSEYRIYDNLELITLVKYKYKKTGFNLKFSF